MLMLAHAWEPSTEALRAARRQMPGSSICTISACTISMPTSRNVRYVLCKPLTSGVVCWMVSDR